MFRDSFIPPQKVFGGNYRVTYAQINGCMVHVALQHAQRSDINPEKTKRESGVSRKKHPGKHPHHEISFEMKWFDNLLKSHGE